MGEVFGNPLGELVCSEATTVVTFDPERLIKDVGIAVNGACLTVTKFDAQEKGGWFEVWLANETLDRTDLGIGPLGCRLVASH